MDEFLSDENRILIYNKVREKYARVAEKTEGHFKYPTGSQGLTALEYPPEAMSRTLSPLQIMLSSGLPDAS